MGADLLHLPPPSVLHNSPLKQPSAPPPHRSVVTPPSAPELTVTLTSCLGTFKINFPEISSRICLRAWRMTNRSGDDKAAELTDTPEPRNRKWLIYTQKETSELTSPVHSKQLFYHLYSGSSFTSSSCFTVLLAVRPAGGSVFQRLMWNWSDCSSCWRCFICSENSLQQTEDHGRVTTTQSLFTWRFPMKSWATPTTPPPRQSKSYA